MKIEPHRFVKWRLTSYQICCKCGLIRLKNKFTAWCIRNGCDHEDHPSYEQMRKHFTKGSIR